MQQQQPHLVAQQLLDVSSKPLQQLMGLRNKPMMNSMANPMMNPMVNPMANTMHTTRLHNQMATSVHNPLMHQQNRSKKNSIFSASDDNVITKQVVDTHLPDGTDVDVKPLLNIVEDILRHATISVDSTSSVLTYLLSLINSTFWTAYLCFLTIHNKKTYLNVSFYSFKLIKHYTGM